MTITFNAFEIFEIAEQIERNGVKFYRKAAKNAADAEVRQMFVDLADMERDHEKIFEDMRKQISYKQNELITFDPENEAALYLQAIASGHVFDLKKDPSEQLTDKKTVAEVLKMAIEAEKDSIVFYLGIKDFVSAPAGKERVEDIITEEQKHIALLSGKLEVLQ